MHVISRKRLKETAEKYSELAAPLDVWYRIAKRAQWTRLAKIHDVWPSADSMGRYTVFNIKGNAYRLIAEINYQSGRVFVRHILTHGEYDRGKWKK